MTATREPAGNPVIAPAWTAAGMAVVCLGLLLQQLLVPLHLTRHEHVWALSATEHVHGHDRVAHSDHDHSHGAQDADASTHEGHRPHPAKEHLDERPCAPVVPPIAVHLVVPPAGIDLEGVADAPVSRRRPDALARCPRPPPPRSVAPARAPPPVA